jgi:hypothetical protein
MTSTPWWPSAGAPIWRTNGEELGSSATLLNLPRKGVAAGGRWARSCAVECRCSAEEITPWASWAASDPVAAWSHRVLLGGGAIRSAPRGLTALDRSGPSGPTGAVHVSATRLHTGATKSVLRGQRGKAPDLQSSFCCGSWFIGWLMPQRPELRVRCGRERLRTINRRLPVVTFLATAPSSGARGRPPPVREAAL